MNKAKTNQITDRIESIIGTGKSTTNTSGLSVTEWTTNGFRLIWSDNYGRLSLTKLRNSRDLKVGYSGALSAILLAKTNDDTEIKIIGPLQQSPIRILKTNSVFKLLTDAQDLSPFKSARFLEQEFRVLQDS